VIDSPAGNLTLLAITANFPFYGAARRDPDQHTAAATQGYFCEGELSWPSD